MQRCKGKGVERVRGTGTQKFEKSPPNELLAGRSKKHVRGEEGEVKYAYKSTKQFK